MTERAVTASQAVIVDEDVVFSLIELSWTCGTEPAELIELVHEGALTPTGHSPDDWRFDGTCLSRARTAVRLSRDLHLDAFSAAIVLDMLDQIADLQSQLRRLSVR